MTSATRAHGHVGGIRVRTQGRITGIRSPSVLLLLLTTRGSGRRRLGIGTVAIVQNVAHHGILVVVVIVVNDFHLSDPLCMFVRNECNVLSYDYSAVPPELAQPKRSNRLLLWSWNYDFVGGP